MSVGEGSCLCGAVRFRFGLPPLLGCALSLHDVPPRAGRGLRHLDRHRWRPVRTAGRGDHLRSYRSSPEATRSFCGRCGSPLFFESTRWPGEVHITLAAVDPGIAATLQPQGHVHWADRAPWIGDIHDGLPRQAESGGASS